MKIIAGVLLFIHLSAASMAPFIHILMSFPAVRETFKSQKTVNWIHSNIRITDIEIINSMMASIMRKTEFIRRRISKDIIEEDGLMLRLQSLVAKLESLQHNANLLYCLGICEYVRSVKSDYDPDFSYLKKIINNEYYDSGSLNSVGGIQSLHTTPTEMYDRLIKMLGSAEPFEKIVEAHENFDILVVDADYYTEFSHNFDTYTVFGHSKDSDAYISLASTVSECETEVPTNKYILIPENEKESREVEDLDVSTVGSYILVKRDKCSRFYEPISLFTNERKVTGFLRALSRVRLFR